MNSNEFIQTINATIDIYERLKSLKSIASQIDEIRKLHLRFQSDCEYLLIDPQSFEKELLEKKLNKRVIELIEYCKDFNIKFVGKKFGEDWNVFNETFKQSKQFCSYYYDNVDITSLIVYVKKERQIKTSQEKRNDELDELRKAQFHGDSFITSEDNKLPGE